jgi:hypothetical protein
MRTRAAILTKLSVKGQLTILDGDGTMRADVYATPTTYASLGMEKEFRLEALRFGVGTPRASQGTPFEED